MQHRSPEAPASSTATTESPTAFPKAPGAAQRFETKCQGENPTVTKRPSFPRTKDRRFVPEPLTPDEVHALIDACSTRSPWGVRLRALIGVMAGSGLRIAETLDLYPKDYDPKRRTLRVLRGKGAQARTSHLSVNGAALLDRWLDVRPRYGLTGRHPIFATYCERPAGGSGRTSRVGDPLSPVYVRNALKRVAERAGIEKRVHPHGLRHSHASEASAKNKSIHAISVQLGHKNLGTTGRYISQLMPVDVTEGLDL